MESILLNTGIHSLHWIKQIIYKSFIVLLLVFVTSCVDEPVLEISAPLLIINTYPANGATVARSDLAEVSATFTSDLGPAEPFALEASTYFSLIGPEGYIDLVREDGTNVAYDGDTFTVRILLEPDIQSNLRTGVHRLVIHQSLTSLDGRSLPTDHIVRFAVAAE